MYVSFKTYFAGAVIMRCINMRFVTFIVHNIPHKVPVLVHLRALQKKTCKRSYGYYVISSLILLITYPECTFSKWIIYIHIIIIIAMSLHDAKNYENFRAVYHIYCFYQHWSHLHCHYKIHPNSCSSPQQVHPYSVTRFRCPRRNHRHHNLPPPLTIYS